MELKGIGTHIKGLRATYAEFKLQQMATEAMLEESDPRLDRERTKAMLPKIAATLDKLEVTIGRLEAILGAYGEAAGTAALRLIGEELDARIGAGELISRDEFVAEYERMVALVAQGAREARQQ
jgi:hypothetical protein